MTAYFTAVSNDLLSDLHSSERMPAGFRLKRVVGPILSPYAGMTLVEFDDDDAPAELAGRTVTPAIQAHYDDHGDEIHTTVMSRDLDTTPWQVVP